MIKSFGTLQSELKELQKQLRDTDDLERNAKVRTIRRRLKNKIAIKTGQIVRSISK